MGLKSTSMSRREALTFGLRAGTVAGALAMGVPLLAGCAPETAGNGGNGSGTTGQAKKLVLRGFGSPTGPDWPVEQLMAESKLYEKYSKELGFDGSIERIEFTSGVAGLEAMLAGSLDQGLVGQTPAMSIISKGHPVALGAGVVTGRAGHGLVVRPDGKFTSLDDLVDAGATIATLVGTTGHQFVSNLFVTAYGKTPEELGLKIVNMPPDQAMSMPGGIDAVAFWSYVPQRMAEADTGELLINEWGYTGPAWTSAPGPGKRLAFLKRSSLYPEGVSLYRNFATWPDKFVDEHPDAIVAYNVAYHEALQSLDPHTPEGADRLWSYVKDSWPISREASLALFEADLAIGARRWQWITYGDVKAIVWSSPFAVGQKIIDKPITWDDAKRAFAKTAELDKRAWEMSGASPTAAEMESADTDDVRGLPTWEMNGWPDEPAPAVPASGPLVDLTTVL